MKTGIKKSNIRKKTGSKFIQQQQNVGRKSMAFRNNREESTAQTELHSMIDSSPLLSVQRESIAGTLNRLQRKTPSQAAKMSRTGSSQKTETIQRVVSPLGEPFTAGFSVQTLFTIRDQVMAEINTAQQLPNNTPMNRAKISRANAVQNRLYELLDSRWTDILEYIRPLKRGDWIFPPALEGKNNAVYYALAEYRDIVEAARQIMSEAVMPGQARSEKGVGRTFDPDDFSESTDRLIYSFDLQGVSELQAKTTRDYIKTDEGKTHRIDRQGPNTNYDRLHAKFAVQHGTDTVAGILMETGALFSVAHVQRAFRDSIKDGTYRRVYWQYP